MTYDLVHVPKESKQLHFCDTISIACVEKICDILLSIELQCFENVKGNK